MKTIVQKLCAAAVGAVVLAASCMSCSLFMTEEADLKSVSFNKANVSIGVGGIEYLQLSIEPSDEQKNASVSYTYDAEVVKVDGDNYGATVVGLKSGNTTVKASTRGVSTACVVSVSGVDPTIEDAPQITSSTITLETDVDVSKKVQVALTNATAADMADFSWSIDKTSIAKVESAGQTAYITGLSAGVAQITVTHPLSSYPYKFCVFVNSAAQKIEYITTSQNIITLNRDADPQTIKVSLMNGNALDVSRFKYEVLSTEESDPSCIVAEGQAESCVITPKKAGTAILRVSNDKAEQPLDIRVRVVTIIKNVYIEPSADKMTLEGTTPQTLTAKLTNKSENYDPDEYVWETEDTDVIVLTPYQTSCGVQGLKNGQAKIKITHPAAKYSREVLVIVENHPASAVNTTYYITTSQNYIKTKVGAGATTINIELVGGTEQDAANFIWTVDKPDVIGVTTTDGTVRSIFTTRTYATAVIEPKAEGSALLTITNPKSQMPAEVQVKVLPKTAVLSDDLVINVSTSVLKMLTGSTNVFHASLEGSLVTAADENGTSFRPIDPTIANVSSTGTTAVVTAVKAGQTNIEVTNPRASASRRVLLYVADTQEELDAAKLIYSSKTEYTVRKNSSITVMVQNSLETADLGKISWTNGDSSVISSTAGNTNESCSVTGLKVGETTLTAYYPGCLPVVMKITVTNEEFSLGVPSIVKLITGKSQNITTTLSGTGVTSADENNTSFKSENKDIATVSSTGTTAVITAVKAGQTNIEVTNPRALQSKRILVYVADTQEELDAAKLIYSAKTEYSVKKGDSVTVKVEDTLLASDLNGISWTVGDTSIIDSVTGTTNESCIVTGLKVGETTLTADYQDCLPVIVKIKVKESDDEVVVEKYTRYLTTGQNVININQTGSSTTARITTVGISSDAVAKTEWNIADPTIATVQPTGVGDTAYITAHKDGRTQMLVTNPESENTLKIIVQVGSGYITSTYAGEYIETDTDVLDLVHGGQGKKVCASLSTDDSARGFSWSIDDSTIATLTPNDTFCYIVPKELGQAQVTITRGDLVRKLIILVNNSDEETSTLPYVSTSQNFVILKTGEQSTCSVRLVNTEDATSTYTWNVTSGAEVIDITPNGSQAVIKGLREGKTSILVYNSLCKYPLNITVIVSDDAADAASNPYITTGQNIITTTVGASYKTINVTLAGGTAADAANFSWSIDRPDLALLVGNGSQGLIKGIAPGECVVEVSHPKAKYPLDIKVLVDPASTGSTLYISVSPSTIISMKPADEDQTVTATLVGGSADDSYGFTWYADNYNVVKLTASGSTGIISPLSEGQAVVTIEHPKSGQPAKVTVIVTEYSAFAFSTTNMTMTEGETQFVSMNIPALEKEYTGKVVYTTDSEKVVTIKGTNNVAQLTAVGAGTATVTAISPSGSKSDMMVYVQKAAAATVPTISCTTNVISMKVTDNQRTLTALLVGSGVTSEDQYAIQWTIDDPKVVRLIGTSGPSVYIKPVAKGETTLHIKHAKSNTERTIDVVVDGSDGGISINKSYLKFEVGKSAEITATIDNGTSTDYSNIGWTQDKVDGNDIVQIMGSGKTVGLYALRPGTTKLYASFNAATAVCDIVVTASQQLSFDTSAMTLQPNQKKTFKYTVVPSDTTISWKTNTDDYITHDDDPANKTMTITGIKEGETTLYAVAGNLKAQISIVCTWDYKFSVGKTVIKGTPELNSDDPNKFVITYTANPSDADVRATMSADGICSVNVNKAHGQIELTPLGEGVASLIIKAYNIGTSPETEFPSMTKTVVINLSYADDDLTPEIKMLSKTGSFSYYDATTNVLHVGDGEDAVMDFAIAQKKAKASVSSVTFVPVSGIAYQGVSCTQTGDMKKAQYTVSGGSDVIEEVYKINVGYVPTFGNQVLNISDFYYTGVCRSTWKKYYNDSYGLVHKSISVVNYQIVETISDPGAHTSSTNTVYIENGEVEKFKWAHWWNDEGEEKTGVFGRQRDPSIDGKIMTREQFESIAWYYCPEVHYGTKNLVNIGAHIMTENIGASLIPTTDKDVKRSVYVGQLKIVVNHNNSVFSMQPISVYADVRYCLFNQ